MVEPVAPGISPRLNAEFLNRIRINLDEPGLTWINLDGPGKFSRIFYFL